MTEPNSGCPPDILRTSEALPPTRIALQPLSADLRNAIRTTRRVIAEGRELVAAMATPLPPTPEQLADLVRAFHVREVRVAPSLAPTDAAQWFTDLRHELYLGRLEAVLVLIDASATGQAWFPWDRPLCFLRSRTYAMAYFGERVDDFKRHFALVGKVVVPLTPDLAIALGGAQ